VHLDDLREALGSGPEVGGAITRTGFALFRDWLALRLAETGTPALVLTDGDRTWRVGDGEPGATLTADRHELFRIIAGRRSAGDIRGLRWDGDPTPYLPVLSPYPYPPDGGSTIHR
jgi:hypothetical protein